MLYAPMWARAFPRDGGSPPLTEPYQEFLRATILRYGTGGSFWRENPAVPRRTIRYWQVWNEPHFEGFWDVPAKSPYAYPRGYARLLSASNKTIHRTDRNARTVTAGLFGAAWTRLAELYRSGGVRKGFDVAAVHVYSDKPGNVLETVKRTNATMRRYKDPGNRVWVTETAFPASRGLAKPIRGQKQDTPASMATQALRHLRAAGPQQPEAEDRSRLLVHVGQLLPADPAQQLRLRRAAEADERVQLHAPARAGRVPARLAAPPGVREGRHRPLPLSI